MLPARTKGQLFPAADLHSRVARMTTPTKMQSEGTFSESSSESPALSQHTQPQSARGGCALLWGKSMQRQLKGSSRSQCVQAEKEDLAAGRLTENGARGGK
eukprot:2563264-Rhodomonas_salina.1